MTSELSFLPSRLSKALACQLSSSPETPVVLWDLTGRCITLNFLSTVVNDCTLVAVSEPSQPEREDPVEFLRI